MKSESVDVGSHARHVGEVATMYDLFLLIWPFVSNWLVEQRRAIAQLVLQGSLKCITRTPCDRWNAMLSDMPSRRTDDTHSDMPALVDSSSSEDEFGPLTAHTMHHTFICGRMRMHFY